MVLPNSPDGCMATYISQANSSADFVPSSLRAECTSAINDLMLSCPDQLVEHTRNTAFQQAFVEVSGFKFAMENANRGDLGGLSHQAPEHLPITEPTLNV